jgi:hypothetical protein
MGRNVVYTANVGVRVIIEIYEMSVNILYPKNLSLTYQPCMWSICDQKNVSLAFSDERDNGPCDAQHQFNKKIFIS